MKLPGCIKKILALTKKEDVQAIVDQANNITPQQDTLFSFIEKFIKESENKVRPATITVYNTTLSQLKDYCKTRKSKTDFEDIDLSFYNGYLNYMVDELEFTSNTVGKNIRVFKRFLNEATDRGINKNLAYMKFKASL